MVADLGVAVRPYLRQLYADASRARRLRSTIAPPEDQEHLSVNLGAELDLQTIVDAHGRITSVVVPIEAWHEIASEIETHHLLRSPAMRERLVAALTREGGASLGEAMERLGVSDDEVNEDDA
jgi:hypothetical protein